MKNLSVLLVLVLIEVSFPQGITLRDTTNQYDYIIITVPEFVQACQTFKQHKESYNGFNVLIVDTGQIYTEFYSDSLPQNNIREFISYAGTYWQSPKPQYILLVGTVRAIPNFYIQQPLPGYNQYHQSDYYYKLNLYDPDTLNIDFNVGRLPVYNQSELNNYFNKITWYETNSDLYDWMNTNLFLCEADNNLKFLERYQMIATRLPEYFYKKFIVDTDSSEYYGNIDSLINFVNNRGTSIIWFAGHPYDSTFMFDPEFLNINDLGLLSNFQKYFVSVYYSQSAIVDSNTNLSREMLFLTDAGSLGAIVINGLTFWPTIASIHDIWINRFYNLNSYCIVAAIDSEIYFAPYQTKVINYWGDPSLKLKYDPLVNVEEMATPVPEDFKLYQNYPSPFNSSTRIKYQIPFQSNVTLKIYDVLGREVATLVNEVKSAGKHEVGFTENNLTSGIYFYTLQADNYKQTKKMILLK